MVASIEQITADALALSFEERTQLLGFLLDSVDEDGRDPFSAAWTAELQRRKQAVKDGAPTFAAEDVFAELLRENE